MQSTLADLWHPLGGINISDISGGRYLFRFFFEADLVRVLDGTPWTFNRHLLVLAHLDPNDDPATVPLDSVDIWVRIYDLPFNFFSELMAKDFGDFIGSFLKYDSALFETGFTEYMHIRVRLSVLNLLKRRKKMVDRKGKLFFVNFKYERAPVFCFLYGRLGHNDAFCPIRLQHQDQNLPLQWDASLLASPRRSQPSASPWLHTVSENPLSPAGHSPSPNVSGPSSSASSSAPSRNFGRESQNFGREFNS